MKQNSLWKAIKYLLIMTVICGFIYTAVITVIAQVVFPQQANGSIIEVDGKKYGSQLLAQQYTDDSHMWGRVMKLDTSTFVDESGNPLMYSAPSNLSPASEEYGQLIAERVNKMKAANPAMKDEKVPVELVTNSGSGLDPHISKAAAEYQIKRLVAATGKTEKEVIDIIKKCTDGKFLGLFGEKTVNVLEVNLMLDGVL